MARERYVAAAVVDLYGEDSSDAVNRERIAHALEVGSDALRRLAGRLRDG